MRIKNNDQTSNRISRLNRIITSLAVLTAIVAWSACGGSSPVASAVPLTLTGNWQFAMGEQVNPDPSKPSFTGGLQGGFLFETSGSVKGQAAYSIMTQPPYGTGGTPTQCNSGVDQITGTIAGQAVSITASSSGGQTFTLTGTLSFDNSTIVGSYTSTDGAGCGIAAAQNWSAVLVPALTGPIQGVLQSAGGPAGLNGQVFPLTGALVQAANNGGSYATVTGSLGGFDPCFPSATVTGQISGNSVFLQLVGADGTTIGQIGQASLSSTSGPQAVTYQSTSGGYALQSLTGTGYALYAAACGGGSLANPADSGSVCLAVNSTTACVQPIVLTPYGLVFPSQTVGSAMTTQTVQLANSASSILDGVTVALTNGSGPGNFAETDNCGPNGLPSQGQPITLLASASCTISIGFAPQQECASGTSPSQCLTAKLVVANTVNSSVFEMPITGGVSSGEASLAPARSLTVDRLLGAYQDLELHAQID